MQAIHIPNFLRTPTRVGSGSIRCVQARTQLSCWEGLAGGGGGWRAARRVHGLSLVVEVGRVGGRQGSV